MKTIEVEKLMYSTQAPLSGYQTVDCFEFKNGNMIVVNKSDDKTRNYNGAKTIGSLEISPVYLMKQGTGEIQRIEGSLLALDEECFYIYDSSKLKKYSPETGLMISENRLPSNIPSPRDLKKIPGTNHMLYAPTTGLGYDRLTATVVNADTLESVRAIELSFLKDDEIGSSTPANFIVDKDFIFVHWYDASGPSPHQSTPYCTTIIDTVDLVSGSTTPKFIHIGNDKYPPNFSKTLGAFFLGSGEESIFFEFAKYSAIPGKQNEWDPLRIAASISRKRLKQFLSDSGSPRKYDGENIMGLLSSLDREEEYLFGYATHDRKYMDDSQRLPVNIEPFAHYPKGNVELFPEYHQGIRNKSVLDKRILSGSLVRSNLDYRISCINPYFPVYRRYVARYGQYQFAYHLIDGFSYSLGGGNYFVEQTSFLMEPIPLFDREITKEYLKDYADTPRSQFPIEGQYPVSASYVNPSHVTPTHLHIFDAEKYTKYKLIFE